MVGLGCRTEREKLPANRITNRIVPVDQSDQIGRHTQRHGGPPNPSVNIIEKGLVDKRSKLVSDIYDRFDGVLGLPTMIDEGRFVDFGVRGDVTPPFATAELAVGVRVYVGLNASLSGCSHGDSPHGLNEGWKQRDPQFHRIRCIDYSGMRLNVNEI
jgi:hypothetical protein